MKKIFFLILGITLSIVVVMNKDAVSQDKQAPKIRIGEFTGASGEEAAGETESDSPKGLTDSDIEFMYRAGLFEKPPGFFRQRFSVAYNLFYIHRIGEYLTNEGGTLVRKKMYDSFASGVTIQYHLGTSFIRDSDWRGNPLLGVNLLLDGSFAYGKRNITSLGVGAELHFLWIFKAALGYASVRSNANIFYSGYDDSFSPGESLPLRDSKNATFMFFQGGISFPVSDKYDVFALINLSSEDKNYNTSSGTQVDITSFRAGVAWKF